MKNKISVVALLVGIALYPTSRPLLAAPLSLPLDHLDDRLAITVGVDGGPPQKYIFDTGSDQLNAVLGQQDTSKMPAVGSVSHYLYGNDDDPWGGYLLQQRLIKSLTYYTAGDNPTAVATPQTGGYIIGQTEHLLLGGDQDGNKSKDPFITIDLGNGITKDFYLDMDAENNIKAGKPTEEQHYYGTFGAGDFLTDDSGGSPFGTVTKSGYIVAGNDHRTDGQASGSPGCAPCTILDLNPALRAQFASQVPWDAQYEDGDLQQFWGSGSPASTQHEGQFTYTFVLDVDGQQKTITVPGQAMTGAILFDTGNPTHATIESAALSDVLQQNGLQFDDDGGNENSVVSITLHPVDSDGNPIGQGIVLQGASGKRLALQNDASDDDTWNITMGIGFFNQYSVMYDLQNRLTAFTPFFVSATDFSTDGQLGQITPEMGNPMKAPVGDPSGQQATKGYLGLAGTISGAGSLTLQPNVVVNMTGANTYTGVTRVQKDAVLFLSGPGSIAASSELVNNGWFDIASHGNAMASWGVPDSQNDVTVQSLSGNGLVTLGSRNLTLSNAHGDFYGRITDLDLRNGGVDHEKGGLIVSAGRQSLSGNSDYTGQTLIASGAALQLTSSGSLASDVVTQGAFIVNGKARGHVEVQGGGLVSGYGQVGSLTAAEGATVAPGNPIGRLDVDGDLALAPGSRYVVQADASHSSQLSVGGSATVQGASLVLTPSVSENLLATRGKMPDLLGGSNTILSAAGGVSGQFVAPQGGLFITPSLSYQPDSVTVAMARSDLKFADVAFTRNQRNVANALEQMAGASPLQRGVAGALPASSPVYQSLLLAPGAADARQALSQLSGQIHADIASALVNNSRYLRDTVNSRLRQTQGQFDGSDIRQNEAGAWASLMGNWQHASGDDNASGFHDSTYGVLLGLDGEVAGGWRVGAATGFTRTSLHGNGASADSDNYHLALYTGKSYDNLNLRAGTAYTWHRIDTARSIGYYGQSDRDKASYNAGTSQLFAEAGYGLDNPWLNLEPFARMAWVDYRSSHFGEHGGASALSADGQHTSAALSTLGLRADKRWQVGKEAAVALVGELGWQHQYNSLNREVGLRFRGAETAFNSGTVPASRDGMVMKVGAEVSLSENASVSLNYNGLLSDHYQDNGVGASLKWTF